MTKRRDLKTIIVYRLVQKMLTSLCQTCALELDGILAMH